MKNRKPSFFRPVFARSIAGVLLLALLSAATPSGAIVFYSTGDQNYNTTAPTGALTNSGWQFEGYWGVCMGTAIASNFFITAKHYTDPIVGDPFLLNGVSYTTTAKYEDPNSDLALWRISGSFPSWAPIYTGSSEVGSPLVVFGAGYGRGAEVWAEGDLKGWQAGGSNVKRWGTNVVAGTTTYQGSTLLYADFDAGPGANEATLAVADSGGGVFIQQNSIWSLAGVNFTVDSPFNTTNSGDGFNAAIFDAGGLYYKPSDTWTYIPNQPADIPASFYATSISARQDWIMSIIVPEPSTSALVALGFAVFLATARRASRRR
ncbi:MAG: PEP-CTERM sorting domain-containing protein [Verrucomicrobia bacterium]|nr:PEP-CTERM sorting domain-containing protein [Verrucomicrobiota bacterium]